MSSAFKRLGFSISALRAATFSRRRSISLLTTSLRLQLGPVPGERVAAVANLIEAQSPRLVLAPNPHEHFVALARPGLGRFAVRHGLLVFASLRCSSTAFGLHRGFGTFGGNMTAGLGGVVDRLPGELCRVVRSTSSRALESLRSQRSPAPAPFANMPASGIMFTIALPTASAPEDACILLPPAP